MAMETASKAARVPAIDFTKGILVLIMVLYHWLNYFVSPRGDFYKYLRFLTPSFICISGFLISHTYFSKYDISDLRLPKRLLARGLKILGVFILLNAVISVLVGGPSHGKPFFFHMGLREALATYVAGNVFITGMGRGVAFYILVPIGYLLLLSAGLLVVCRQHKYTFHAVCAFFLVSIFVLHLNDFQSANLELITIGLLGVILGYLPARRINSLIRFTFPLAAAYLGYLAAITFWREIFPLQVVGVFLSLAIIYMVGTRSGELGLARRSVLTLGKYSLFGYIAQVALLQLLHRTLRHINLDTPALGLTLLAGIALTLMSVIAVDQARGKAIIVDRLYKAVFA
jgi:peptidoglycan/LPS O-acetylase OafA/YrhL